MQEAELIQLLVVIAVVIAVFAIIWFVLRRRKTNQLREKFGDEYDRTVDSVGGRSDAERGAGRWSADAWLLVREGDQGTRLAGVDPASYGADQVGAVLRYALAPDSLFDPQAYGRASKALVRDGEAEVAGGLSVRLARRVPVRTLCLSALERHTHP